MSASAISISGGDLGIGEGLLAIIRPALTLADKGAAITILSSNPNNKTDLPRWCQIERHQYVKCETASSGEDVHHIIRGEFPKIERSHATGFEWKENSGWESLLDAVPFPKEAAATTGFAPRGAFVERGGNVFPFPIHTQTSAGTPEVAKLYEQATRNQWCAEKDIPWKKLKPLPAPLDWALSQVMTFLAENELSALYLPSRFVSQIHPYFMESAMFLSTQMVDESRHIQVFMKRAWACGGKPGLSSVVTSNSLLSLIKSRDWLEASFLLSVLGEGTFLDLLSFIENHAPDEVTETLVNKARQDESRHVHFGIAHTHHALNQKPELKGHLSASVERRASDLASVTGAPTMLQDSLVLLAAGGTRPAELRKGHQAYRDLLETMESNRIKRLTKSGFIEKEAKYLSELHTPNFM